MKKTLITIAVLAVVGFGIYYIASKPALIVPVSNNPTASTTENTVSIKNFSFNPPALTVKTGTKVTWINNDAVTHTITVESNGPLDSAALSPGESFSFVFHNPRFVSYICTIHPMMKGEVIIEN